MYTQITIADTISMPIAAAICMRVIPKAGILIVGGFGLGSLVLTMLNTYGDKQFSHLLLSDIAIIDSDIYSIISGNKRWIMMTQTLSGVRI